MKIETQRLKSFLLDAGLIDEKALAVAEKKVTKDKGLSDILVAEGKISEDDFVKLQGYILGMPFVSLENEKISDDILRVIPEPIARTHNIIAYKKTGNNLEVAMLDPGDLETIEFIKKTSNLKILPRITSKKSIKNALSQYRRSLEAEFGDIIKKDSKDIITAIPIREVKGAGDTPEDLEKTAQELPIVRIVDTLLQHAIVERASDIHIEINEYKISFRVSILPVSEGEKAVMRLLIENSKSFALEALGFFGDGLEKIHKAIKKPVGMVLATGPTGSGKTTTLYTILDILNTPEVNISTIEDPIEYRMPRVNQTQVRPDIGFTFADGLRSLVRQDPDIIMVGEIRDNETASLAINASLTGHL